MRHLHYVYIITIEVLCVKIVAAVVTLICCNQVSVVIAVCHCDIP